LVCLGGNPTCDLFRFLCSFVDEKLGVDSESASRALESRLQRVSVSVVDDNDVGPVVPDHARQIDGYHLTLLTIL
jgi:hypothetical protein